MNRSNNYAHAPYNFVPLPTNKDGKHVPLEGKTADHDRYDDDRRTGYFDVTLETVTPLFVRGMLTAEQHQANQSKPKDEQYVTPYCFMVNGKPVIPGSSLRGMIRSLVEIITFGKMHFVSDSNKIFFRAVAAEGNDPHKASYETVFGKFGRNVHSGYLEHENGNWYVRPAKKLSGKAYLKVKERVKPGKKSKFAAKLEVKGLIRLTDKNYVVQCHSVCYDGNEDKVTRVYTPMPGQNPTATLVCTGNMAETSEDNNTGIVETERVNYALIGLPDGSKEHLPIHEQVVKDYVDGLTAFQMEKPYFDEQKGILQVGKPIFYIEENGEVIRFGHTPNFRIAHVVTDQDGRKRAVTPRDCVPKTLLSPDITDYTEAMFGFVPENDKDTRQAYAGRVFVTSATLIEKQSEVLHNEELKRTPGSPKPTTFQHYLEQPKGKDTQKRELHHYGSLENGRPKARIRGHKLYWRQRVNFDGLKRDNSDGSKPKLETKLRPVKAGISFKFRVFFENLTNAELGALAWALTLGGDKDAHHMLGMGKPYGLGMVKLTPTLYLSKRRERYSQLFDTKGQWYRAEDKQDDNADFITAFKNEIEKHTGKPFEKNERIKDLMRLLRLQTPAEDNTCFSYMELEEFKERRVLPKPSEVVDDCS
jgi:CRISPR-associated protein (TIGR03986 family)